MKLDSRIIEGKKPLDCFDAENRELMKSFLNKDGYFSNNLADYCFLNRCHKRFLSNVFKELRSCFTACINGDDGGDWKYFLPAEWVKEEKKEPKYRPYTKNEFLAMFEWGKPINIRHKDDGINVFIETLSSVKIDNYMEEVYVRLYERAFDLKELFDEFEWQKSNGEWHPFGVEE